MTLNNVNHLCRALLLSYPARKGRCSLRFGMHLRHTFIFRWLWITHSPAIWRCFISWRVLAITQVPIRSFEGRQRSRILCSVDFLESHVRQLEFELELSGGRALESKHISPGQLGSRPNADPIPQCLCCLHEVDKGIFGLTLNPRHVEIMSHFQRSFREIMEGPYTDGAYPSVIGSPSRISHLDLPEKQAVEAQHSCNGALYQREPG